MQLQKICTEETVANALDSDRIPYQVLCKSHTFEALHRSNLEVLKQTKNSFLKKKRLNI